MAHAEKIKGEYSSKDFSVRYHLLDTLRGVMMIGVVFFHLLFDLSSFGMSRTADVLLSDPWLDMLQIIGRMLFVLICGICSRLSRNNLKRGLIALAFAAIITAVTYAMDPNSFIFMGILHLLGLCMVISHFVLKLIPNDVNTDKRAWLPAVSAVILTVLFAVTFNIYDKHYGIGVANINVSIGGFPLYGTLIGYILGFGGYTGFSADYFPIIPWVFAFFAGMCLGGYFKRGQVPKLFTRLNIKPLSFIGRHSLIVYVAHQPVIYGICYLLATQL